MTFSFDGSSTLATQIIQGAPADMFASADQANMDKITTPGLNSTPPTIFATNLLTIIVPKGNPKGITGVADLANPDLKVVLCADGVPCGTYARQILASAGVTVTPVSEEQNVGGVVTKVTSGEADAGIVYVTDVQANADKADSVAIPADINVIAKYPIAALKTSTQATVDAAFIGLPPRPRRPGHPGEVRLLQAVTTTAPAEPDAVRHRRVGRERLPVPILILAVIAVAFFALPFIGLLWKAPWGDTWSILTSPSALDRPAPVASTARCGPAGWPSCSACRSPGCWPASSSRGAAPPGRCAPCRWCFLPSSPAWPCSTPSAGGGWSASTWIGGSASRCPSRRPA